MHHVVRVLGWLRARLRAAWPRLMMSRVAVLGFVLGAALLWLPEQTRAVVAELTDSGIATAAFLLGVLVWSFTLWFWARWALTLEFGLDTEEPVAEGRVVTHFLSWETQIPRFLALLAGLVGAAVAARGTEEIWSWPTIGAVAVAATIYLLTSLRRRLVAWIGGGAVLVADQSWQRRVNDERRRLGLPPAGGIPAPTRRSGARTRQLFESHYGGAGPFRWAGFARLSRDLAAAPFGRGVAYGLIGLALLFCLLVWVAPGTVPPSLGAAGAAMLALAALTTLASISVLFWGRHTGLPSLTLLLVGGFLAAGTAANNHDIRQLDRFPAPRPTLREAAARWLDACAPGIAADAGQPLRLVLVATAGGASRAGLWTTTVLDTLAQDDPALHRRLFGISGVSGGSLGAAAWVASLAEDGLDCGSAPDAALAGRGRREQRHAAFFAQDHLAAPMAAFLSTDPLWWGFVPFNLLANAPLAFGQAQGWGPPDRAAALERSWETAWRRVAAGEGGAAGERFGASFHALWREGEAWVFRRPLLFLNGTHQATGLPVVTAPARLDQPDFLASHDLVNLTQHDLRLSTAATNSARFPYVTPTGGFRDGRGGRFLGNLVDGGYFDNQGAATLSDVALALHGAFREKWPDRVLRLMVVQVSSDPGRRPNELVRCADLQATAAGRTPEQQYRSAVAALEADGANPSGLDAPLAPLLAVAATQAAHTVRSSVNLARVFCSDSPALRPLPKVEVEFAHFRLCPSRSGLVAPLNWVLPRDVRAHIQGAAMQDCENAAERDRYRDWLNGPPVTTAAAPAPGR